MKLFWLVLRQTVLHSFRKGGGAFGALAFYLIIVTLFTFALGPTGMTQHAGAVMCVALLLASLTALPLLYERDHEDGTLEQFLLQPVTLEMLVLAKIMGQWIAIIGPILLASPLVAALADLPYEAMRPACILLVLASPTLVAIGSVAASLTLGNRRGGLLQALVILPLTMPVLIFAASSGGQGAMLMLSGLLFASLPLSCLISAALIRLSQD